MATALNPIAERCALQLDRQEDASLRVRVSGSWTLAQQVPDLAALDRELDGPSPPARVCFESSELGAWDSALLIFLRGAIERCGERGLAVESGTFQAMMQVALVNDGPVTLWLEPRPGREAT